MDIKFSKKGFFVTQHFTFDCISCCFIKYDDISDVTYDNGKYCKIYRGAKYMNDQKVLYSFTDKSADDFYPLIIKNWQEYQENNNNTLEDKIEKLLQAIDFAPVTSAEYQQAASRQINSELFLR